MTEKFNKCKKNSRKIVTILLVSLLLTGCETDISVFDNYEIPLSQSSEQDISEGTTADNIDSEFLSADICVVPKKKQSQKDSFMTAGHRLFLIIHTIKCFMQITFIQRCILQVRQR